VLLANAVNSMTGTNIEIYQRKVNVGGGIFLG
jgi:hypothetical protein